LVVSDLQSALVLATAANDKPAMMCYPALIQIVQSLPSQVPPDPGFVGVVTSFEKARLLTKRVTTFSSGDSELIQSVNLACGALYMDAKGDVARLLLKFRP
jgi:hypothetical protein